MVVILGTYPKLYDNIILNKGMIYYEKKDSKYHIASALVNYESDQWTKDDIEKANEKVADRIIKFLFDKK